MPRVTVGVIFRLIFTFEGVHFVEGIIRGDYHPKNPSLSSSIDLPIQNPVLLPWQEVNPLIYKYRYINIMNQKLTSFVLSSSYFYWYAQVVNVLRDIEEAFEYSHHRVDVEWEEGDFAIIGICFLCIDVRKH